MALVEFTMTGSVAVIAMDDGKANAMGPDMIAAVNDALDRAESEASAVVIIGREGAFCGGFDLKVIRSGDAVAQVAMTTAGAHLALRLYGFPKPVVMAATGHSVALGGFLLLAADHRIGDGHDIGDTVFEDVPIRRDFGSFLLEGVQFVAGLLGSA